VNSKVIQDPLSPPDLLVNGNMRVNWRTAWAWTDLQKPIGESNLLVITFAVLYSNGRKHTYRSLRNFASHIQKIHTIIHRIFGHLRTLYIHIHVQEANAES
jgi:hypothetical protein